jgi:hypothetical protein
VGDDVVTVDGHPIVNRLDIDVAADLEALATLVVG